MSLAQQICHNTMSHDHDILSETLDELNILIDDLKKIVSDYNKLPLFDMRSITLNRYWTEEGDIPHIFGSIKEQYASTIMKYYPIQKKRTIRHRKILYTYSGRMLFFLNDNSDRCIILDEERFYDLSFSVSGDIIHAKNLYLYELNKEICEAGDFAHDSYDCIYTPYKLKISTTIDKLVREENYCIIYTNMAIFLIDNEKIKF